MKHAQIGERGNAFFFILLGVAMFAALAYTVASGMRGGSTTQLSGQRASLAASDILGQAQKIDRGVNRLRTRSVSENDISFANTKDPQFEHSSPQPTRHRVFHKEGGNVSYISPPPGANNGSEWFFTGATCMVGIGNGDTANCSTSGSRDEELLMVLPNMNAAVCQEINKRLGINGIPEDEGNGFARRAYKGEFEDSTYILALGEKTAGCFLEGRTGQGGLHFVQVLLAR